MSDPVSAPTTSVSSEQVKSVPTLEDRISVLERKVTALEQKVDAMISDVARSQNSGHESRLQEVERLLSMVVVVPAEVQKDFAVVEKVLPVAEKILPMVAGLAKVL
jgi:hypothetical protein